MRSRRGVVLVLVVLFVVGGPVGQVEGRPETDTTVTRIAIAPDGTATWEVQVRTRLPTDQRVADYEAFQREFRANTSQYLDPFRERMRGVAADAANATGRPMEARNFSASTTVQTVPRRWGIVAYEFEWTNFAAEVDRGLVVGDVFGGQFYLTENDTLEIVGPDGYAITAVDPEPAERTQRRARWFGRRTFPDERPRVRFEPVAGTDRPTDATTTGVAVGDDATTDARTDGASGTATARGGGAPGPTATTAPTDPTGDRAPLLAIVSLVALAAGAYRYRDELADRFGTGPGADERDAAAGARSDGPDQQGAPVDTQSSVTGAADAGDADGTDAGAGASRDPVLTDADRVVRLLERNEGRLPQSEVVAELDWSKSKTSRVLSDMAADGEVEKLRIGRRNVIFLPDAAPDDLDG